jgi:hypothetical protein
MVRALRPPRRPGRVRPGRVSGPARLPAVARPVRRAVAAGGNPRDRFRPACACLGACGRSAGRAGGGGRRVGPVARPAGGGDGRRARRPRRPTRAHGAAAGRWLGRAAARSRKRRRDGPARRRCSGRVRDRLHRSAGGRDRPGASSRHRGPWLGSGRDGGAPELFAGRLGSPPGDAARRSRRSPARPRSREHGAAVGRARLERCSRRRGFRRAGVPRRERVATVRTLHARTASGSSLAGRRRARPTGPPTRRRGPERRSIDGSWCLRPRSTCTPPPGRPPSRRGRRHTRLVPERRLQAARARLRPPRRAPAGARRRRPALPGVPAGGGRGRADRAYNRSSCRTT